MNLPLRGDDRNFVGVLKTNWVADRVAVVVGDRGGLPRVVVAVDRDVVVGVRASRARAGGGAGAESGSCSRPPRTVTLACRDFRLLPLRPKYT